MDLYGRPAPRRTSTPPVVFLNERPKAHSFSSGFPPPGVDHRRREDENLSEVLPDRPVSNQHHVVHQWPSSRYLNRPQSSSGVRRSEVASGKEKQRPRTARDGVRTLPAANLFAKRSTCFTKDTANSRPLDLDVRQMNEEREPSLDERYLQQLKADILHLHHVRLQLEKEAAATGRDTDRHLRISSASQAPNHVKNLLLHRSMDLPTNSETAISDVQTQLQRYNNSTDPTQLTVAKVSLEGLLADALTSLMELCLARDDTDGLIGGCTDTDDGNNKFKLELLRPPASQQHGEASSLPFANGCGTSPVSIYAGGIISVLQQTEILKCTVLACTGEKKLLTKAITDKDAQIKHLAEQIGVFKDVLARKGPQTERIIRVRIPNEQPMQESHQNDNAPDTAATKSAQATEQLDRLAELEKERVKFLSSIHAMKEQNDKLVQQLEKTAFELQYAHERFGNMETMHQESMDEKTKAFLEQIESAEKRASELQSSAVSTSERYRALEISASQEKAQLRRDKQELERLIRLKEDEATQRQAQATTKADMKAQATATQLKLVTQQCAQALQSLCDLQSELKVLRRENKKSQDTNHALEQKMRARNSDIESLSLKLTIANNTIAAKAVLLQKSEERITASSQEIQRQQDLLEKHGRLVRDLEAKLSRSIPVDDEELQSRQQREESTWNQRVSALEHALVAERQNTALFQEQQRKAVTMEKERAAHAVKQAESVAAELATANLCLSERKRQRDQEQHAFEEKLKELADRTAMLASDKESLQCELNLLRREKLNADEVSAVTEKALREELGSVKAELQSLTEIRVNLDRALAHALSSPSGKKPRHQATLSEVRAELQKAKQKITALEEAISSNCSIRASETDGKLAQLSARERRFAEDQRGLKKQRADVATERRQIQTQCIELEATASKQKVDHDLIKQIVVLLAQRLHVLMELFNATPAAETSSTLIDTDKWNKLKEEWTNFHQQLESVDWELLSMRDRLEELHQEYVGSPFAPIGEKLRPSRSSLLPGFHGPNPFSDAVAAGRDTVPVADELKASHLLRRLSCPGESFESRVHQVKAEEHETFALALAREMTAMKDGYERQLEQLRGELHKTQQLRKETRQRLRAELAAQHTRSERVIAELTERLKELETSLENTQAKRPRAELEGSK